MTTIATDGEVMAADSCVSGDYSDEGRKIHRIGKSVYGIAGDYTAALKFLDWRRKPRSKPDVSGDFEALEINAKGIWYWDNNLRPVKSGRKAAAIGSGAAAAMGAMLAGKGPRDAVKIACQLDAASAPPVIVEEL